jgi:glucose-6-phosphate 1-dehydrogenase
MSNLNTPANIVIFGGYGDLAKRKLLPALYNLYLSGHLPENFDIIGVHHKPMEDGAYQAYILDGINQFSRTGKAEEEKWNQFSGHVRFFAGDFTQDEAFARLNDVLTTNDQQWGQRAVRLFYYSVAPRFIEPITNLLSVHNMASEQELDRIVVEKPFGNDLESAKALNKLLTDHFNESQIFRIDHYLGKETVQNIMAFRFTNILFEPLWNRNYVDQVQITVAESLSVEGRGRYYDQSGALRDMIQNHLLQLLCEIAMEPPNCFKAQEIRNKKTDVLNAIRKYSPEDVAKNVVRGQYGEGKLKGKDQMEYRREEGVEPASTTETFVAAKMYIDNWRWQNVPFYLRTGKSLPKSTSLITIQFKPLSHLLFDESVTGHLEPNQLFISIQPEMKISIQFQGKVPGLELKVDPVEMNFNYKEQYDSTPVPEAYETLLLDVLEGDATLFMRADQVEAAWAAVMPILNAWKTQEAPLFPNYAAGSWGPEAADELVHRDGFRWALLPEPHVPVAK